MFLERYCLGKCCYSLGWWILRDISLHSTWHSLQFWCLSLAVFPEHLELKHPSLRKSYSFIVRAKVTLPKFIYSLLWWLGRFLWKHSQGFHFLVVSLPHHQEQHYQLSVFKHKRNGFRMKLIWNVVLKNEGKYVINKTFISNSISVLGQSAGECLF